ncbi:helix-turn-helix domain-containing protein [Collinsella bouchesdurhonensis]|uniref:helix-turn-helix domain-containing protein n=1 Tax=Collinsella bouchesdurhonensis TaxID=1907654 RepID=UPI003F92DD94
MEDKEPASGIPSGTWPVPPGLPLYVSVEQAAKLAGIGRDLMYEYVNSRADPIPQMRVGRSKTLIRTSAIPEYLRRRETA